MWINGGTPCGEYSDLGLARLDFTEHLDTNEMVIADLGYHNNCFFETPLTTPESSWGIQKRIRSRHETVNARLKVFNVLSHEFRHSLSFHVDCFYAVANIVQLNMMNGESLFQI